MLHKYLKVTSTILKFRYIWQAIKILENIWKPLKHTKEYPNVQALRHKIKVLEYICTGPNKKIGVILLFVDLNIRMNEYLSSSLYSGPFLLVKASPGSRLGLMNCLDRSHYNMSPCVRVHLGKRGANLPNLPNPVRLGLSWTISQGQRRQGHSNIADLQISKVQQAQQKIWRGSITRQLFVCNAG